MSDHLKIIPIFLPYAGCKHRCIFCDQPGSTGVAERPTPEKLDEIIRDYLKTSSEYEIAFYGGTFTGLDVKTQEGYLKIVEKWIRKGKIRYIRISTRPDEIDENISKFLKENHVRVIEIGVQSMDDRVLEASRRAHTAEDSARAIKILKKYGFEVGAHLMTGLPKSTYESDIKSAKIVADLGVDTARIHPTLVFRNTELHRMMEKGRYVPLSIEEALERTADMLAIFECKGIKVIRMGLHVPVELRKNIAAGPFHPSFGDMTRSYLMRKMILFLGIKDVVFPEKYKGWFYSYGNRRMFLEKEVKLSLGERFSFDGKGYGETLCSYVKERLRW